MNTPPYDRVAEGPERRFAITGGLVEGYGGDGAVHTLEDVLAAHHAWQRTRRFIAGITVAPLTFSYGFPRQDEIACASEPGFLVAGCMNVQYHAQIPDEVARGYIESLAAFLADRLGQQRIYYSFMDRAAILERS
jgi:hypothetical protein